MTRIFIPSKGRASTIRTHQLFLDYDYYVVVHNADEFRDYRLAGVDHRRILISGVPMDQFGLTRQREYVCQHLADPNEWFVFADDNIRKITAVTEQYYLNEVLDVQDKNKGAHWRTVFGTTCPTSRFIDKIVPECIHQCQYLGAHHMGFAVVDNHFFRANKWKECAYIIGKLMLWHNYNVQFDHTITMEDFDQTARSLHLYGVAPVNNYVFPVAGHYEAGGMGTLEQRLPDRTRDVQLLLRKYPNLFNMKARANGNPDLQLRYHNTTQIAQWQRQMRFLHGG